MIKNIQAKLKTDSKSVIILKTIWMLFKISWFKISGGKKKYPKVIQFPITYKCNSKCVMCNIWKMDSNNEMNVDELAKYVQDPLFKKVTSVGINGGEPTLIGNLVDYVKVILELPKIRNLNIISNGFISDKILSILKQIYNICKLKSIRFHISFSLDGYGEVHDLIRGVKGVFQKTVKTIDAVASEQSKYCDSYDVSCTIVKQNIYNLAELDAFSKYKKYPMKYRLGISNKRINSDSVLDKFSILSSKNEVQIAKEFLFGKYKESRPFYIKFRYFSLFYYLNSDNHRRLLGCAWKNEGVTLDSRGDIYYCACKSKKIGSLREKNGKEIFFNKDNIQYRKELIKKKCNTCIHDYNGRVEWSNLYVYLKYNFHLIRLYISTFRNFFSFFLLSKKKKS